MRKHLLNKKNNFFFVLINKMFNYFVCLSKKWIFSFFFNWKSKILPIFWLIFATFWLQKLFSQIFGTTQELAENVFFAAPRGAQRLKPIDLKPLAARLKLLRRASGQAIPWYKANAKSRFFPQALNSCPDTFQRLLKPCGKALFASRITRHFCENAFVQSPKLLPLPPTWKQMVDFNHLSWWI